MLNTTQLSPSTPFNSNSKDINRNQAVNQILWQILIANLMVAGAKIAVGMISMSISILADGFHSTLDASSNVVALIGSTLAGRPPDADHPYGHQKFETFATLGIGLILILTSWQILQGIVSRLAEQSLPHITALSFAVMIITIIVNIGITTYEQRQGKKLQSQLLLADAAHTRSDIFVSVSVLISLGLVKAGLIWVDALVAMIIVFMIGYTGLKIVREASGVLADSAVVDPTLVEEVALSVEGVKSCHKIRSRGSEQAIYLDLHIQLNGDMLLEQAHELGHITQRALQDRLQVMDVLVHVEPYSESEM